MSAPASNNSDTHQTQSGQSTASDATSPQRRLIVNADDFGLLPSINSAAAQAHRDGVLTSASLMVNAPHTGEAIALALDTPSLGVGLHLTLACGRSILSPEAIPNLVNPSREFRNSAVRAGLHYFFSKRARQQLEAEIEAQVNAFHETGLVLDHVNGHLNLHLHPVVLDILVRNAKPWKIRHLRLVRDPLRLSLNLARGRLPYRLSHAAIFSRIAKRALPRLQEHGIGFTDQVFGLLQNAHVDPTYLKALIPNLPPGTTEIYSHPCQENFPQEFEALTHPDTKRLLQSENIHLTRYQDLPPSVR